MQYDDSECLRDVKMAIEKAVSDLHMVAAAIAALAQVELAEERPNSATEWLLRRRRVIDMQLELQVELERERVEE